MDEVTPIDSGKALVKKRRERSPSSDHRRSDQSIRVFEMRLGGKLPTEIATELKLPLDQVLRMISELFAHDAQFLTNQERTFALGQEVMRLDRLQAAMWDQAMMGDPKSVDAVVKIIQTRARITGLEQADPMVQKNLVLVMGDKEEDYIAALKATNSD
jgi:hypothetical protein